MPTTEEVRKAIMKALKEAIADGLIIIDEDGHIRLSKTLVEELNTQPIDARFELKA